jgi:tetratricopeptide (TPR) repeat protein
MLKRACFLISVALAGALGQQHSHSPEAKDAGPAPLLDGLGHLQHAITTSSPQAQRYFDQGLTLVYGFNHAEAARSFRYAAKLDPTCAMCYWGVALAVGPNYNDSDIDMRRMKEAVEASRKAASLRPKVSENERAYALAMSLRFSLDPKADRKQLAVNYKNAMGDVMKRFPNDLDAAVLYADAAMNLHPWQLWKPDGKPEDGTREIVDVLRSVLKRAPDHIGANHLYIHATEASAHPEEAMQSAERLKTLAPAAGHLVHMPAHTFIRTGDYHAASVANEKAAAADEAYFNKYGAEGMYPVMYYAHNLHFLAVSSSMEGRFAVASGAARKLVALALAQAKDNPMAEQFLPTDLFVLVRFRRWAEIQQIAEPGKSLRLAHAFWRFSLGMADSGTGQLDKAGMDRNALAAEIKGIPAEAIWGYNSAHPVLNLAAVMLDANIARARRDYKQSAELLRRSVEAEDRLNYNEPPDWYLPPRESLGAVLFTDGRYAEAEVAFRAELKAHAKNPRALFGLAESLRAQKKTAEEAGIRKDFEVGWKNADTKLSMADF